MREAKEEVVARMMQWRRVGRRLRARQAEADCQGLHRGSFLLELIKRRRRLVCVKRRNYFQFTKE